MSRAILPRSSRLIISIVAVTIAITGYSPVSTRAQSGAVLDSVRSFLQYELVRQHLPGFSVAVVVDDQLVWSEGFGIADLEAGDRATGSTIYRIGSVSKPVVGTALMQLVEKGLVDLDADIRTYIPEFPRKRWTITLRHLMTHTSGIRHYRGDEFLSMVHYDNLVEPMRIFAADTLLFEPGSRYSYSTYGFNLVANVVENVSGLPIQEYMQTHVYTPAWMNNTGQEDWTAVQHGRAKWYSTRGGTWFNEPYVDLSNKYAGGGITSTVEDLCRLHIAYARGTLLQPRTIEQMYTNQPLLDGSIGQYGLSWRVGEVALPDGTTARTVQHSGGSVGANTLFIRFPDHGFAIAVVANHGANLSRITNGVINLFALAGAFGGDR
ncbi:serine hydrolase domain-containing protein [Candidatus Zixiibacteriota bacterium]